MTNPAPALFTEWKLDAVGEILGTGFCRFRSRAGIDGLAKIDRCRDGIHDSLEILALATDTPGQGQFTEFLKQAKAAFPSIVIWEIWNERLFYFLKRAGFRPVKNDAGDLGMAWTLHHDTR